ncbi:replication-relaxation family protein [Saccharopolyspora sp. HNM0986]|uniref:replication-relaxation family protein n=1 Tax=Saccharopolyspora galaxeae TaxID=2781241 RepID=UPI00190A28EA|nr:replication-relaxation family protein [Saccharopolyspora sp. HNM0986]MBK0870225.1 replication-relaxation family protein [Saccharopolyspora sp. HNM0986]
MPKPAWRQRALRNPRVDGRLPRAANTIEHHVFLVSRLTPRDRWLAAMVHEHRVLTSTQITQLAFPSERATRARLRTLFQWSVLDRFQPFLTYGTAPMHYVLGPAGASILAAQHGFEVKDLGYRRERAFAIANSLRLTHQVATNDLLCRLAATAPPGAAGLTCWWSETRCARHLGDLVRPDAYARWNTTRAELDAYLEIDLGTESLTQLARKLPGYHDLARATGQVTQVLIWLPTARRETAARRALHRTWTSLDDPSTVPLATATPEPSCDPTGPVWLPLDSPGPRRSLDALSSCWPQLSTHAAASDTEAPAPAGATVLLPPPAPRVPTLHPGRR